jgi:hypothetical protein
LGIAQDQIGESILKRNATDELSNVRREYQRKYPDVEDWLGSAHRLWVVFRGCLFEAYFFNERRRDRFKGRVSSAGASPNDQPLFDDVTM